MLDRHFSNAENRVRLAFEKNFSLGREVGAAVSIWHGGEELVSLHAGHCDASRQIPWSPETLVLIWSATKGVAAACALRAMELADVDLETPVAEFWPEFASSGKSHITTGDVLSHQAGLAALDDSTVSILDHDAVARAIENQRPLWNPEDGHGYGPRTFGCIVEEFVRRLTHGVPLADFWRHEFADPLGLDLWIGLPEKEHPHTATMLPPKLDRSQEMSGFLTAFSDPHSLTRRAFSTPGGLLAISSMNDPATRSASIPSMGGIGSASALAKFYSMLAAGGQWQGTAFLNPKSVSWLSQRRAQGFDKVLQIETAFSSGFMMDPLNPDGAKTRSILGPSLHAFGHPGAGGSLGFADPENQISFAYVMNQMEPGVLPRERANDIVHALYHPR